MDEELIASTVEPLVIPEIVAFPEEIDISNAVAVTSELIDAFRPGVAVVIADLRQTTFCDSSAIRCLLVARDRAADNGSQLRVVAPSPAVRRSLHIVGADNLLSLYGSLHEALTNAPPLQAPEPPAQPT